MKLSIHLDHPGAELELEALAGEVLLQLVQPGRLPVTVILSAEAAGQLVDFAGAVATVAQDQARELAQLVDKVAPSRAAAPQQLDPAAEPFPAYVGPLDLSHLLHLARGWGRRHA